MRDIKFRAWDGEGMFYQGEQDEFFWFDFSGKGGGLALILNIQCFETGSGVAEEYWKPSESSNAVFMQFTGLQDRNGKDIYEGDIINVFYTMFDGEHVHDGLYEVSISNYEGVSFQYQRLLWESYGHNQHPIYTRLSFVNSCLSFGYRGDKKTLMVADQWDKHHLTGREWKQTDESNYIEVIGTIHENPELLEQS